MSRSFFGRWFDGFRGGGDAAVTIPSMDGALQPNNRLDAAEVVYSSPGGIANVIAIDGRICFSSGDTMYGLSASGGEPKRLCKYDSAISALAAGADGALAVGLSGGGVRVRRNGQPDLDLNAASGFAFSCPTALAFEDANTLIVCNGSARNPPDAWRRDLMEKNRSGGVWRVDLAARKGEILAADLGFPSGVVRTPAGDLAISESWRHRLIRLRKNLAPEALIEDLPGYPGAISPAADGYWLSVFAPRRQLIEFVLREDAYRQRMMSSLPEAFWMAPALRSGQSYLEPVQSGGVRQLGQVKPWAPTRSYGLLVQLDADFNPKASFHSRADGVRHGVTSAVEHGGRVFAASSGAGLLLALDPH